MAQIILSGDGMTIEIEDEIARSDELLKRALAPHYPDLANALIAREEKEGTLKVTLSKRAGPKGSDSSDKGINKGSNPESGQTNDTVNLNRVALALHEAPDYLNPALALAWQLSSQPQPADDTASATGEQTLTLEEQLALQDQISEAILEGEEEAAQIKKAVDRLKTAPGTPSYRVPKGF